VLSTEDSLPTAGILEMGGASTQIAFVPNGNVLADKFPVRIGHVMYSLYVHSYLDYGQTAVIKNIMKRLESENPKASRIDNPCLMTGMIHPCVLVGRFTYKTSFHKEINSDNTRSRFLFSRTIGPILVVVIFSKKTDKLILHSPCLEKVSQLIKLFLWSWIDVGFYRAML